MHYVHQEKPGFFCKNQVACVTMVRDSGRIMSLHLCTMLSDALLKLSRGDMSQTRRLVGYVALLVKVLDMLDSKDRHKLVITQRIRQVLVVGDQTLEKFGVKALVK